MALSAEARATGAGRGPGRAWPGTGRPGLHWQPERPGVTGTWPSAARRVPLAVSLAVAGPPAGPQRAPGPGPERAISAAGSDSGSESADSAESEMQVAALEIQSFDFKFNCTIGCRHN